MINAEEMFKNLGYSKLQYRITIIFANKEKKTEVAFFPATKEVCFRHKLNEMERKMNLSCQVLDSNLILAIQKQLEELGL